MVSVPAKPPGLPSWRLSCVLTPEGGRRPRRGSTRDGPEARQRHHSRSSPAGSGRPDGTFGGGCLRSPLQTALAGHSRFDTLKAQVGKVRQRCPAYSPAPPARASVPRRDPRHERRAGSTRACPHRVTRSAPPGVQSALQLGLVPVRTALDAAPPGLLVERVVGGALGPGVRPPAAAPAGGHVLGGRMACALRLAGAGAFLVDGPGGGLLGALLALAPVERRSPRCVRTGVPAWGWIRVA